jgi:hypothetical protein
MTNDELYYILNAIGEVVRNAETWADDYRYSASSNEFYHLSENGMQSDLGGLFTI